MNDLVNDKNQKSHWAGKATEDWDKSPKIQDNNFELGLRGACRKIVAVILLSQSVLSE